MPRTKRNIAEMLGIQVQIPGSLDGNSTTALVICRLAAHALEEPVVLPTDWHEKIRQEAAQDKHQVVTLASHRECGWNVCIICTLKLFGEPFSRVGGINL